VHVIEEYVFNNFNSSENTSDEELGEGSVNKMAYNSDLHKAELC
jgi:hypothetical protein